MSIERQEMSAVLFADISGSTKLYVEVGDGRARVVVAEILDRWSALTAQHSGRVVQVRGDGMLCTFPTIDAALAATIGMRDLPYQAPLSMHAGIHVGAVLREAEQLYGDAVNLAARMADIAKRFEIVISEAARDQLSAARRTSLRLIKQVPIKGKTEPVNIYLLPSAGPMVTEFRPPPMTRTTSNRLSLHHGGQAFVVDAKAAACLIGRDSDCIIKVQHRLVSRRHASIEYGSGRFFLQDHSTNGTYIDDGDGGRLALVQREIYQLKGKGVISLGVEPKANPYNLIRFTTGGD